MGKGVGGGSRVTAIAACAALDVAVEIGTGVRILVGVEVGLRVGVTVEVGVTVGVWEGVGVDDSTKRANLVGAGVAVRSSDGAGVGTAHANWVSNQTQ